MSEKTVPAPRYVEIFMYETREGHWKARIKLSNGEEHMVCLRSWNIELQADPQARFTDMLLATAELPQKLGEAFGGPKGFSDAG